MPAAATHPRLLPDPPGELESLFREHHDRIFRTAYRLTGSVVDAEDVLQTVFMRLARRSGPYELAPNPEGYLLKAAINAALDLGRARRRMRAIPLDEAAMSNLAASPMLNPEALHLDLELRGMVREAIAHLGTRTAEMFVLRYFEGHDNREIAQLLGTTQMVVAVTLHRARTRLRKEIGKVLEKYHEA